jgi:hypothetical protein
LAEGRSNIVESLIFADTVAIANPASPDQSLGQLRAGYPHEDALRRISGGLRELIELKPLLDAGLVEILPVGGDSLVSTAAREAHDDPTLRATLECLMPPDFQALYAELAPDYFLFEDHGWIRVAYNLESDSPLQDIVTSLVLLRLSEDARFKVDVPFHPYWIDKYIALSKITKNVFTDNPDAGRLRDGDEWLQAMYGESDLDQLTTLERLVSLKIPRFDAISYADMAILRSNSDELAAFRSSMRSGFRDVEAISIDSPNWKAEAKACMNDALAGRRKALAKELDQASTLRHSLIGTKKFGVSAMAGGAAWRVGGNFQAALASAAVTAAGQTLMDLIDAQRSRARQKAVLNLYGIFDHDDLDSPG